jgi:hypothetical protein
MIECERPKAESDESIHCIFEEAQLRSPNINLGIASFIGIVIGGFLNALYYRFRNGKQDGLTSRSM